MPKILEQLNRPVDRLCRRPMHLRAAVVLLVPALVLLLSQFITIQSVEKTAEWFVRYPGNALYGWFVLALVQLNLWGATGSLFWSSFLLIVPGEVLSFVSYYENIVNGVPLRVSDFVMVGAAGSLISFLGELRPTLAGAVSVAAGILLLVLLYKLTRGSPRLGRGSRAVIAASSLLVMVVVTLPQINTVPLWEHEETVAESYARQGFLLGLYRSVAPTVVEQPARYSQEWMEQILAEIPEDEGTNAAGEVQPTVVFFMSESFFDVTRLPNVEFSGDPVSSYHALSKACTSGHFYSNTYGGGTGNVEMEVFTGLSSSMLGVHVTPTTMDEELYGSLPSIVKLFKAQGYQTAVVHAFSDELYNRGVTFPRIGFDELYFEDSFPENTERKGGYISDSALVDQAIRVYEQRDKSKPMFLYVLSMENHQPYPEDKFEENCPITATGETLTELEEGILNSIVTGIYDADQSLRKIVNYFAEQEEPVMLVFWGDHLPSLYTGTETGTVYTSLYFVGADDLNGLTEEELKRMVSTDYLIWTNYEQEPLPDEDTSSMMLGVQVLDRLGIPKSPFFRYVSHLEDSMLLYREKLFLAADGTPTRDIPEQLLPEIQTYAAMLYDMLYGEQYITDRLNAVP